MTLGGALSSATTGLQAASRRASLVSNNIANALTPGYARRELAVSEQVLDGGGAGVRINGVSRASDPAVTGQRRSADGLAATDTRTSAALTELSNALGEPGDGFSLFGQYENLESSLRSLAESPESVPLQNQVLDSARALTVTFNQLSTQTQTIRQSADAQIERDVATVNSTLQEIERLNDDIVALQIGGNDASAQLDQRQQLIDQISELIPVREINRDFGAVDIITQEGAFLLAGEARTLEFSSAGTLDPTRVFPNPPLSGIAVDGVDITPGSGFLGISQGGIAGSFAVRDDIGVEFQTKIDALARDVIERFEGIDPTLAPGDPGLFTDAGAALDPANETGLAGRIAINAAADPNQGGDVSRFRDGLGASAPGASGNADYIRAMLDSLTALKSIPAGAGISGDQSAVQAAAALSSDIGSQRIRSENQLAISNSRAETLKNAELQATAVDTDQELQKLILIEQAYAANARVIQTIDEMLQLLNEI